MQPLYIEAISDTPEKTGLTSRLLAKWAGSRLGEFIRRPAVSNTLAVTAFAVGSWLLYDQFKSAYDALQAYQDATITQEILNHMSGSEAYNMMQSGADIDYGQYTQ